MANHILKEKIQYMLQIGPGSVHDILHGNDREAQGRFCSLAFSF